MTVATAAEALLELAFSQAINSFRSFTGRVFPAKSTTGLLAKGKIGAKSFKKIVWKRIESTVQHIPRKVTKVNRVAIWPRASSLANTDASITSADIFDDDGLSKRGSHWLGDKSPDDICNPARSSRHDKGDGA